MAKIDCLLVGYLGITYDNISNLLINENIYNEKIEKEFCAAVAYLGTYLKRRGFSFDYINYFEDESALLTHKLKKHSYKAVGISTTFITDLNELERIVSFVRNANQDSIIILGGAFIAQFLQTYKAEHEHIRNFLLRKIGADFYIDSFEGDDTLVNILSALNGDISINQVDNIFYRRENKYIYTSFANKKTNLEENMIDWGLFTDRIGRIVPVRTSISCPFSCSFCNYPINMGNFKQVSVEAIEKELDSIQKTGKVQSVHFIDDTFNLSPKRFKNILHMIIKNNYSFRWNSYLRCQYLDDETVELMRESKCEGVLLGIESGNQKMLDIMNKKVQVQELQRGIELLNKYNIVSIGLFFNGFPGETYDTVKDTIDFIENTKPTFFQIQPWIYDERTPISKKKEIFNIKGSYKEWSHESMDYNRALKLTDEAISSISNSIYLNISPNIVFQLLNDGVQLGEIKNILNNSF